MALASESKILFESFIQKQSYLSCLTPTTPFRLFKSSSLHKQLSKPKICLPLKQLVVLFSRFTDPLALKNSASHISVWSENHLQFLKLLNQTRSLPMEKLILKNPFKTEKLIRDCIDFGLHTMVVDSFEQLSKIHQYFNIQPRCRSINKTSSFQPIPIKFVWMVTDPTNDLTQIDTLKGYHIKLGGLFFDQTQTKKINDVKMFIEKTNKGVSEKKRIRTVYLESGCDQFDKTHETYQNDEFFVKNKIETILEKTEFKMTDKYWIAARVIGQTARKQPVLNEQAYNYLSAEQVKRGNVIEQEGRKWVLSSISHFPDTGVMEEHERKGYIISVN